MTADRPDGDSADIDLPATRSDSVPGADVRRASAAETSRRGGHDSHRSDHVADDDETLDRLDMLEGERDDDEHDAPQGPGDPHRERGALAWMARNSVAANALMFLFIVGGIVAMPFVRQEVFPTAELDLVNVVVPYPGASPAEVEQGVVLPVEEAVRGVDGVKTVTSVASESVGRVSIELLDGYDRELALSDIKGVVDRITLFPVDAERPVVSLQATRQENIRIVVHGDVDEAELRRVAVDLREALLARGEVTLVELDGVRPPEIAVEVPEAALRGFGLTLAGIADAIRQTSVELPAGALRTSGGEVLLRTAERRNIGTEFESVVVRSNPDGSVVRVGDVATVVDGFRETDQSARFDGQRAALIRVYRVGMQTPIGVSDHVRAFVDEMEPTLPDGVSIALVNDGSERFRDRIDLLLRNARMGLVLVLLALGLFLDIKLAFWVTLGIPISFLGAILFMPAVDASLNMISLFAFILTLGIVVDDAIVVGESVHHQQMLGKQGLRAAIDGVRAVAGPVVFAVLTTIIAFVPLYFVGGSMGRFMAVVPLIVMLILLVSLIESLFILPSHLAHFEEPFRHGLLGAITRAQQAFGNAFDRAVKRHFSRLARGTFSVRYLTVAIAVASFMLSVGMLRSGRVPFTFFPQIESDTVTARLELPFGTPVEVTEQIVDRIEEAAAALLEEHKGAQVTISRGILSEVGAASGGSGSHLAQVTVYMVPIDKRTIGAAEFSRLWRQRVGDVAGVESLTFRFNVGPGRGQPVDVLLSHTDIGVLEAASSDLAARLAEYAGALEVNDGFAAGKPQLDLTLRPEGRAMGLTQESLARQVRAAFFGAEAVRQQRGRDEIRVWVRRPIEERSTEHTLETFLLRAPDGTEVPLAAAANIERGRAYTSINREDGRRIVSVTSDVDLRVTTPNDLNRAVHEELLPGLLERYPGLTWEAGGQAREQSEAMADMKRGTLLALLAMAALMAVALASVRDSMLIMLAIPFGLVGAVLGHVMLGYSFSIMSIYGLIALAGVGVNDAIVLIDAVNTYRKELPLFEALVAAATRRFRPILLTSVTTFFGLAPMLLETSVQARFLIPMAVSLAFGVLLTTIVTLLVIPSVYLIVHDVQRAMRRVLGVRDDGAAAA